MLQELVVYLEVAFVQKVVVLVAKNYSYNTTYNIELILCYNNQFDVFCFEIQIIMLYYIIVYNLK